jgi:hypothetical protein
MDCHVVAIIDIPFLPFECQVTDTCNDVFARLYQRKGVQSVHLNIIGSLPFSLQAMSETEAFAHERCWLLPITIHCTTELAT